MVVTQALRSVSPVHVVSDAKAESLLAPVISRWKAIDDSLENFILPCEKKCRFPPARLKRKTDEEIPHGSLPPSPKKHSLSCSYVIADLTTVDLPHKIPQEHSKCKAYGDMPDGSFPPSFKRRTLSCSYAIADLTAHSATEECSIDPVLFLHAYMLSRQGCVSTLRPT
ncbi:uncharacterized protein EDB91DRAFT_1086596 [Suillus paluster]|uniref:uncharacterized protein n=1 Tax=Suillus paluster TaxID=48578 RepID=UPI001B869C46|nr:uncharacterized protein EDB91DRAFT_1086596 [Suillus paluster]KAG1726981.1 hypothetical protein EDB91DRAFT_1086596 [Suillus paluster]